MFLILLKSSEVPLLIFTYYSPSVGCAAHDDVGQPLIPQSKGRKERWKLSFFRGLNTLWLQVLFQVCILKQVCLQIFISELHILK